MQTTIVELQYSPPPGFWQLLTVLRLSILVTLDQTIYIWFHWRCNSLNWLIQELIRAMLCGWVCTIGGVGKTMLTGRWLRCYMRSFIPLNPVSFFLPFLKNVVKNFLTDLWEVYSPRVRQSCQSQRRGLAQTRNGCSDEQDCLSSLPSRSGEKLWRLIVTIPMSDRCLVQCLAIIENQPSFQFSDDQNWLFYLTTRWLKVLRANVRHIVSPSK